MIEDKLQKKNDVLETSLLSELLSDKDDSFKVKILNLVARHGLEPNDPLFHFLITADYLQVMVEEVPVVLDQEIARIRAILKEAGDSAMKESIRDSQKTIRKSVEQIIDNAHKRQLKDPKIWLKPIFILGAVFLFGGACGVGATLFFPQWQSSGIKIATNEQALSLAWAESEQGRFARDLYEWNRLYLESGNCEAEAIEQGITINLGNQTITQGICTLFIRPPTSNNQ